MLGMEFFRGSSPENDQRVAVLERLRRMIEIDRQSDENTPVDEVELTQNESDQFPPELSKLLADRHALVLRRQEILGSKSFSDRGMPEDRLIIESIKTQMDAIDEEIGRVLNSG